MPKCAFITLGCKVNQYDTQAMREVMAQAGYREVSPRQAADVYVVNTCTVTHTADTKSARAVRRLLREHPRSRIVIAGCGVDSDTECFQQFAGQVIFVNNQQKLRLPDLLSGGGDSPCETWRDGISQFSGHTRAFVKIQDGCDAGCAYCIVPSVRGGSRVRPVGDVIDEIGRLADAGYREVVLTGIHLGRHPELPSIVAQASTIKGLRRLRLSSIEAIEVTEELLDAMAAPFACKHFHLPLQSGSNNILRRMRRPYSAELFLDVVERIRSRFPDAAVSSDVMVGFPGETDSDFDATVDVCRRAAFSRLHIFRYSDRPGTIAASMPDKCGTHITVPRANTLKEVAEELSLDAHRSLVGRTLDVLVEHRRDRETGKLNGLTNGYVRALFDGEDELMGTIVPVRIDEAATTHVEGVRPE